MLAAPAQHGLLVALPQFDGFGLLRVSSLCFLTTSMNKPIFVRDLLAAHFAPEPLERLAVVRARFPHWMRPDVQRGLEHEVAASGDFHFYGARLRGSALAFRFSDLIEEGSRGIAVGPPVHDELEIGEAKPLRCLQRGLWLVSSDRTRLGVLLDVNEGFRRAGVKVEITAPESARCAAEMMLARVRATAERAETWRGKVLAPSEEEYAFDEGPTTLRVVRVAPVRREEIVLAAGVLELVERNTLGFAVCSEALVRMGMSGRKGVLLYGPPGTGKTLLVRYLARALDGYTTFLLAGDKLAWLADTVEAARLLAPALIVIEDVDLVGAHRDGPFQQTPATLNRLLNDMDGVEPESRVIFVLTTNRPEALEPALAARPGRVDQAIGICLPDDRERRILLRRYAGERRPVEHTIEQASRRIGKVSPAFIKELVRRAAQAMLEREGAVIDAADLNRALADMAGDSGRVTAKLLGAEGIGFISQP